MTDSELAIIRTAVPSDAAAICDVVRRSISECCASDHQNDPAMVSAWLANKTPEQASIWIRSADAIAVVAVLQQRVLGFAFAVRDELALCYAAPEVLYQGVGRALLCGVESHAVQRGIRTIRLASTRTAHSFYVRNGFAVSGPVQVWAGMEGIPMEKHLAPGSEPV